LYTDAFGINARNAKEEGCQKAIWAIGKRNLRGTKYEIKSTSKIFKASAGKSS
jgi:hypothetical protein